MAKAVKSESVWLIVAQASVLGALLVFCYLTSGAYKVPPQLADAPSLPVGLTPEELDAVYRDAYTKGYRRCLHLSGDEHGYISMDSLSLPDDERRSVLSESDRAALAEAEGRGYTDGYHAAGESSFCPRNRLGY